VSHISIDQIEKSCSRSQRPVASILRQPACSAIHACTLRRPTVMGSLAVALWHSSSIVS
jgi:hypothetical protein